MNRNFEELKSDAKECIKAAIESLMTCIEPKTKGYKEQDPSHIDDLHTIIAELSRIKRKL